MATFELDEAGLFPPGTKVEVFPRHTDHFAPPGGNAVTSATVGKDGKVRFAGLTVDAPYFAAALVKVIAPKPGGQVGDQEKGEWHSVSFTPLSDDALAHPDLRTSTEETTRRRIAEAEAATAARRAAERKDPLAASPAPGRTVQPNRVTGSRSSSPKTQADLEARRVHQRDAKGPQRSDTVAGEAVPTDREPAPSEKQEQVPKRTKQRSDTRTGEAARKSKTAERAKPQPRRGKQSSATKRGESTRKRPAKRRAKPRARKK